MKLMKMMKHVLLLTDAVFDDVDPYPKELIIAPGEGKNLLVYSQRH